MYTYPTLDHLRAYPMCDLMGLAGLTYEDLAKYFHRSPRTLRRWRENPPPQLVDQLIALGGWMEIHGMAWQGWRVTKDALYADNGMRVTPGEIRALPWLWAIRAELLKKDRHPKVKPMAQANLRKRQRIDLIAAVPVVTKPHAHPCAWGFTEIRTG